MDTPKPLANQLAECEQWCSERREEEYRKVATKGLRVLPEHHAELAKPLPGQTPQADGWLLRSGVIGSWQWLVMGFLILAGIATVYVTVIQYVERTDHPFLYATLLTLVPAALIIILPLRMLLRSYEMVFSEDVLVVRRRIFGRLHQEWRLSVAGEVRVGLAYRGVQVSRGSKDVGTVALLSVVVASGGGEVEFGTDVIHEERARLAILIDHYFNGVA
jgi:hypothetical protein